MIVLFNVCTVVAANAGFVYMFLTYDSTITVLTQISLACFKIAWTRFAFYALSRRRLVLPRWGCWWLPPSLKLIEIPLQSSESRPTDAIIQGWWKIVLLLCNNVLIPVVTASVINTDCFYNAFVVAQSINVNTDVNNCIRFR
jgi:hypothetical protein